MYIAVYFRDKTNPDYQKIYCVLGLVFGLYKTKKHKKKILYFYLLLSSFYL